jgi:hypothetical protein
MERSAESTARVNTGAPLRHQLPISGIPIAIFGGFCPDHFPNENSCRGSEYHVQNNRNGHLQNAPT